MTSKMRSISGLQLILLTTLAMVAFAGNSLLGRAALKNAEIDPASFTAIRIGAGALVLWIIVRLRHREKADGGNWLSAFALFTYAAGFSLAYLSLPSAVGALLLFSGVQVTMIGHGLWSGEKFKGWQIAGLLIAAMGLVWLFLPGISVPPLTGSLIMIAAGVAWGIYSLRGRGAEDANRVTAGNFLRASPLALGLVLYKWDTLSITNAGVLYAVASGALASGLGYVIWYSVLPHLRATSASVTQLSVAVITALGGVAFLDEALNLRIVLASILILGGIALVIRGK